MNIPHCSHDGFFAECYNDMLRRTKKKSKRDPNKLLLTGHVDYLHNIGCKRDAAHVHDLLKQQRRHAMQHVCLPDGVYDTLREEERVEIKDGSLPLEHFRFPYRHMTISHYDPKTHVSHLYHVVPADPASEVVYIFPMSIVSITRYLNVDQLAQMNMQMPAGATVEHAMRSPSFRAASLPYLGQLAMEPEDLASIYCWSSNTFALELKPASGEFNVREWMVERNKIEPPEQGPYQRAVVAALKDLMSYAALMLRPAEEVHAEIDPNWVPKERPTYTQKRQGAIETPPPRKLRVYVPKRVVVGIQGSSHAAHAPQKEHVRSGHWRTYKSGHRVWVDSYVAGDPKRGSTVRELAKTIELVPRR